MWLDKYNRKYNGSEQIIEIWEGGRERDSYMMVVGKEAEIVYQNLYYFDVYVCKCEVCLSMAFICNLV